MAERNGVMMQYFHWYTADDGSLWREVKANAKELAAAGITALWLPPAYKGLGGAKDVGYAVYDMYDLGEFDQKGSVRTKYGTHKEYLAAIEASRAAWSASTSCAGSACSRSGRNIASPKVSPHAFAKAP